MGLGSKVHHRVNLLLLQHVDDQVGGLDVALDEPVAGGGGRGGEEGWERERGKAAGRARRRRRRRRSQKAGAAAPSTHLKLGWLRTDARLFRVAQ